jgi:hypothetical protein
MGSSNEIARARHERRAAAAAHRSSSKNAERRLEQRVTALEKQFQSLAEVSVHNFRAVRRGMNINDTHITVLQMIANDVSNRELRVTREEPSMIEFDFYYAQHRLLRQFLNLMSWVSEVCGAKDQDGDEGGRGDGDRQGGTAGRAAKATVPEVPRDGGADEAG